MHLFLHLQVHSLVLEMVAGGVSLNAVQVMLSLAYKVKPHSMNVTDLVKESLINCLGQLEQSW